MLATTAARTGGLCMACKQGIRQHIESAKVYYQDLRQPDPFRDYWTALVHRVHDTPDGFYRLSPHEQTYFSVCLLDGEVYNGGMHQFFHNSSGDYYAEALRGLEELGATRSHGLLLAACREFFPCGEPPRDTAARRAILPEPSRDFDDIEREYWADPDELGDRLRRYALDHHLIRPAA
jgi:hypothetical protein